MKTKLNLLKKEVSILSDSDKKAIVGGNAWTTSFGSCTGFTCCDHDGDPYETTTIVECTLLKRESCVSTTISECCPQ